MQATFIFKTGFTCVLLSLSSFAFSQSSIKDLKNGQYGSAASRTTQIDSLMQHGLSLRTDQMPAVHEINLRYSKQVEEEVVKQKGSDWSKYRKLSSIQKAKDKELKAILTSTQFEKYVVKRDELFWQGVKDFFF